MSPGVTALLLERALSLWLTAWLRHVTAWVSYKHQRFCITSRSIGSHICPLCLNSACGARVVRGPSAS